ncbi:ascorbate oxidase [Genlisea aurea]|uniref:L-ascorbate oxidase n=1 Tax=Genlisea aurea TaxID=192259 RepID=S8CWY9_9LAMI|nr:ascorbate oxidase [Genlisea aurea]
MRKSMSRFIIAFTTIFIILFRSKPASAATHEHKWEVEYAFKSPDCYRKLAITINGQYPGPTIAARQGDAVVVTVRNGLLTENVAIHWHGIRQYGTPWMDGTAGVTQCPILPGESFVYRFVVERAGTYLYHAHYGIQRQAGLYGMIEVSLPMGESEPFSYDFDRSIILADWYHANTYEQFVALSSVPFVWIGDPSSILIQGRGKFKCSTPGMEPELCNATSPECVPHVLTVVAGKTYRIRIGSLTSLAALSFEIEGHNMTVVEADGHYVEPMTVKNLFIYSGEAYSVLVTADQDASRNYWTTAKIVSFESSTPQGLAIFNYYPNRPLRNPPTTPPIGPRWDDAEARSAQSSAVKALAGYAYPPPRKADRRIVMLNTQNTIDGHVRWAINNVSLTFPQTPYLIAYKENFRRAFNRTPPPDDYDFGNYDIYAVAGNPNATENDGVYRLKFNSTVDVVLQNANTLNPNTSETHPWHLHGHDFWVLGYGSGEFDRVKDPKKYNLLNPIKKNTVAVQPYSWTALRFTADNPGVWAFHCHIEPHFLAGMAVIFEEGVEKVGKLPSSIMGCGLTKGYPKP